MDNQPIKYCECGCGKIVKNGSRFATGHHNKQLERRQALSLLHLKVKSSSLCACNCGKYASPGKKYIQGHGCRGRKLDYEMIAKQVYGRRGHWPLCRLRYCECGCGKVLKTINLKVRFVSGHNGKGKKRTEKQKKHISEGIKKAYQKDPELGKTFLKGERKIGKVWNIIYKEVEGIILHGLKMIKKNILLNLIMN